MRKTEIREYPVTKYLFLIRDMYRDGELSLTQARFLSKLTLHNMEAGIRLLVNGYGIDIVIVPSESGKYAFAHLIR